IELLREKVADGVLEAEIHTIIAENIWLIRDDLTYWFSNKQFATKLGDRLAKEFKFASGKRPDLVCYDDRTLQRKQGDPPQRIILGWLRIGVKEARECIFADPQPGLHRGMEITVRPTEHFERVCVAPSLPSKHNQPRRYGGSWPGR